jgi:hypothetical protein
MAAVAMTSPVLFTFAGATRIFTDPASMSAYESSGSTVPNTTITSAESVGLTRVRLPLAVAVPSDSTWTTAGNYTITESGGAAAVTVSSAAVGHDGSYIDLTTTAHTASGSYSVAWTGLTGVTAGSDAYTPTALPAGRKIRLGANVGHGTIVGNVLTGGTIEYTAGTATVTGNDAFSLVS